MKRGTRTPYVIGLGLAVLAAASFAAAGGFSASHVGVASANSVNNSDNTTTPIKHVVVIFDENETFDHYFGTYPYAANTDGTTFCPAAGTPGLPGSSETVNTELAAGDLPGSTLGAGYYTGSSCSTYANATSDSDGTPNPNAGATPLIARDPNAVGAAGTSTAPNDTPNDNEYQPQRIPDTDDITCGNDHGYTPEEEAEDYSSTAARALMNDFVQYTSAACGIPGATGASAGLAMDYYDGNSATALWNYAQNYAMSDNAWDSTFGPTTPGNLNMFAGTTYNPATDSTYIDTVNPLYDDYDGADYTMSGPNIGTLLSQNNITWGWFEGGFTNPGTPSQTVGGELSEQQFNSVFDAPDFWESTSNEDHTPPASPAEVGFDGPANHMYDTSYFTDALNGTDGAQLPAVSFLRSTVAQSEHPSNSGPLDGTGWIASEINQIEASPYWPSTAIVVEYDDSDGWYDHQSPTDDIYTDTGALATNPSTNSIIYNSSDTGDDAAICTSADAAGVPELGDEPDRCGPSQRLPFLVISPYAKKNYVDHSLVTVVSTLKFIEQNWNLPPIGPYTFDNLPQISDLDSFFDWQHPQQNEVLLDATCQVTGLTVVANTCNNTTAHAIAGDGITDDGTTTDAGYGAVQATPTVSTPVPVPPVVTVPTTTISVPASATGNLSTSTIVNLTGATTDEGTLTADLSDVNLQKPGAYTATVSATYDASPYDDSVPSMDPVTVQVDVVPTINVPKTTLTYEASNPPTAAQILSDSQASINTGTLDTPTIPTGDDLSDPGTYTVQITGSADGQAAIPVSVTVNIIPDPTITVARSTVYEQVGEIPTPATLLSDAGASINTGSLSAPDLSGVDFTKTGSYTVTLNGSSSGFSAASVTITVQVINAPAIQVPKGVVAYLTGSDPTAAEVLTDAGATISEGTLAVGLSGVNFDQPGSYTVSVTGSNDGIEAPSVPLTVRVVAQPTVTLGSRVIDTLLGATLTSDQVLADAGAVVSDGGLPGPVDLSGVNFSQAGDYTVSIPGSLDGLQATPATLTLDVITQPKVILKKAALSYPVGSKIEAAKVLAAAGASVNDGGQATVDLSSVDSGKPKNYSVQIIGTADGIAATPATVTISVRPVITLAHHSITYRATRSKPTPAAVLKAAGAAISSGSLSRPSLSSVIFSEAGTYKVRVTGRANGVSADPITLTITVKPKLRSKRARVTVARDTRLTSKVLINKLGATLRDGGTDKLTASLRHVNTREPGTYRAQVIATGTDGKPAASLAVNVVVRDA